MKIGLYDADGHNFPSLPLMKISAYHKSKGDEVEFATPIVKYDKVYVSDIWGRGYTTVKPLKFNEQGIVGIAVYLIKEPILGKRWCASKNLKKPKTSDRDGRLPKYKIKEWYNSGADNRKEIEKAYEDYSLADIKPYHNEINGGYYITVLLYKKPAKKRSKKKVT